MARPSVREKLLAAALDSLYANGFNACGVQDITDAAGVPKGSFYNHFPSKEALGVAALNRYWESAGKRLEPLKDTSVKPKDRLRNYFRSLAASVSNNSYCKGCLIGNFANEMAAHSPLMRKRLAEILEEWTAALAECIREAQKQGEISSKLPATAIAGFLINSWEGALMRTKVDKNDTALQEFDKLVFGFFCKH